MSNKIPTTEPRGNGLVKVVTRAFEAMGVLNKGSADSPATPSVDQEAGAAGVNTNSLNVTRVGGLGSLIAAAGLAALAIFSVDKDTDASAVVVAAYLSVGAIVAAALLTVAIIVSADIRSRVGASIAATRPPEKPAAEAEAVVGSWRQAVDVLRALVDRLERDPNEVYNAWLDASASSGLITQLKPSTDLQVLHARLQAGQSRILSKLEDLIEDQDADTRQYVLVQIKKLLDSMDRSLQHQMHANSAS